MAKTTPVWPTLLLVLLAPRLASAHAFGQQYTLPVPAWLFIYGGAAAVVVSFVLIGYFVGDSGSDRKQERDVTDSAFIRFWLHPVIKLLCQVLSVGLLLLTISTGIWGTSDPNANFTPAFFWIIFLLGGTYATAIFGNLWLFLNPWRILVAWYETVTHRQLIGRLPYPSRLAHWPAFVIYFGLIWLELLSNGLGARPVTIAEALLGYSLIVLWGVILFGAESWFKYGDFFSVFFRLVGKIAPVEYHDNRVVLRPPFTGLLQGKPQHVSLLLFILFMLSSTAFDGFRSTTKWMSVLRPFQRFYLIAGHNFYPIIETIMLIVGLALFFALYMIFIWLMKVITQRPESTFDLAAIFAYSLIPIAFVYNVAHYFTLLLVSGQAIIGLVSDPLGVGWNLFGTAGYAINVAIIGAAQVWYLQVAFIIGGHIASVYVAHLMALSLFPSKKTAILSQYPMLALMIIYTMTGLWILSQPLSLKG